MLLVDDHAAIREPLSEYLYRRGFHVDTAANAIDMRVQLSRKAFDLIVLDIMLPGEDGLSLCRFVTQTLGTPIIFLSAKAAHHERVEGLVVGADDYVTKPFDPPELVARIQTVLRRQTRFVQGRSSRFCFEGWILDMSRRELFDPNGRRVSLGEAEFQLMSVLVSNPNSVLSREDLLDLTRRPGSQVFDRSIDTQISRLRRKIEVDPRQPSLIKTAWGNGYVFVAKVHTLAA
ncbi:response regulator [Pectobacterium actinidiae]|uniref:response regulator n=1 Tax=Pectobacterium actinidiae TaxID=1507808 RepID=UPI003828A861